METASPVNPETTSTTVAKLDIRGITKKYGDFTAVDSVNLSVAPGEFLTLLGQSGSGKTTLLMAVAGLIEADAGQVWIDGKDATLEPPHRRDLGMIFQNYALFPHLTVAENIAFPLRMRRYKSNEVTERVQAALDQVQLPNVGNRFPSQLSGGQQQRIAFARGTVYNPSILLMDEPLGALDKKLRDELEIEIKHFQEQLGITILYVTHDQDEALTMSDRICLVHEGQIAQLGTPADLYYRPRSRFVASFVGLSNLLQGEYDVVDGHPAVRLPNGQVILSDADRDPGLSARTVSVATFRPELVRISGNTASDASNTIMATIVESIFMGDVTRLILETRDGQQLTMNSLSSPIVSMRKGEELSLTWPVSQTTIFPHHERSY